MRRSDLSAALALLLALTPGCPDASADAGKGEAAERKADAEKILQFLEANAEDARQFPELMKQAAKARVEAWGEKDLLARIETAAEKARVAHQNELDKTFAKVHEKVTAALDKKDPAESENACKEALQAVDRLPPAVAARVGTKADDDRKLLVERIDAAKRAIEVMAKAKELAEAESNIQARAVVRSFELVPHLKASPFEPAVHALLDKIPEKAPASPAGGAEEIVIFDGSSDDQFTYFDKQHDWTWKAKDPNTQEPVLYGDNTESTSDDSTIWIGDDTWGDLVVEVQFNVGDGQLQFHARQKDEQTFDLITLANVNKGDWSSVRIELKGKKAIVRLNGTEKVEQDLQNEKGKFGLTLSAMALVKVRSVKLKLLDKSETRPQKHVVAQSDDDDKTDTKKKKKKKPPAGGDKPAGDKPAGGTEKK